MPLLSALARSLKSTLEKWIPSAQTFNVGVSKEVHVFDLYVLKYLAVPKVYVFATSVCQTRFAKSLIKNPFQVLSFQLTFGKKLFVDCLVLQFEGHIFGHRTILVYLSKEHFSV